MAEIRYVTMEDKEFWYSLDKHLPKEAFERKCGIGKVMYCL